MEHVIELIAGLGGKLGGAEGAALTVLGVLFFIAKAASNQKAGPVISKVQKAVDGLARLCLVAGQLLARVAELLAKAIQSDGLLGRK